MPHRSGGSVASKGASGLYPHFFSKNCFCVPNLAQPSAWAMSLAVIKSLRAAYHGGVRCGIPGDNNKRSRASRAVATCLARSSMSLGCNVRPRTTDKTYTDSKPLLATRLIRSIAAFTEHVSQCDAIDAVYEANADEDAAAAATAADEYMDIF